MGAQKYIRMADGTIVEKTFGGGGKLERERIVEDYEIEPRWVKATVVNNIEEKINYSLRMYHALMHNKPFDEYPTNKAKRIPISGPSETISDELDEYEADILAKRIKNKLQIKNSKQNNKGMSIQTAMVFIKNKLK